jgi:hypothetical protein
MERFAGGLRRSSVVAAYHERVKGRSFQTRSDGPQIQGRDSHACPDQLDDGVGCRRAGHWHGYASDRSDDELVEHQVVEREVVGDQMIVGKVLCRHVTFSGPQMVFRRQDHEFVFNELEVSDAFVLTFEIDDAEVDEALVFGLGPRLETGVFETRTHAWGRLE